MATNFIQSGDRITVASSDTIASGDMVVVGDLVGVALGDATTGSDLVLATEGVWNLPKDTLEPAAVGDVLYTDAAGGALHATPVTDDIRAGLAVEAADTLTTTVKVKLAR